MKTSRWVIPSLPLLLCLIAVGIFVVGWIVFDGLFEDQLSRNRVTSAAARSALQRGDYARTLEICQQLLLSDSERTNLLMMAGESASRLQLYGEAIDYYDRVPDADAQQAAIARWAAGEIHLHLRNMSPAIEAMQRSLELQPSETRARERLIYLLNLCGRRWEASQHLFELVRQGRASVQQLMYLGNIAKPIENESELQEFLSAFPNDSLPKLGLARIRLRTGKFEEARRLLNTVAEQFPDLVEAHVQFGRLWMATDAQQIPAWNRELPTVGDNHPDIWLIRGEWAREQRQAVAAVRCFGEAIRLDPNHLAALNSMAQVLNGLGRESQAKSFALRATQLEKLVYAFEHIMSNEWTVRQMASNRPLPGSEAQRFLLSEERLAPIVSAAELTLKLGRMWESKAWIAFGLSIAPAHKGLHELAREAQAAFNPNSSGTQAEFHLVDTNWLREYPLPVWNNDSTERKLVGQAEAEVLSNRQPPAAGIEGKPITSFPEAELLRPKFEEIPNALNFDYFASRDTMADGRRMFEFTGGGVGVLDYDRDGWPDLFLAQGCNWPSDGTDHNHSDRLKRNLHSTSGNTSTFQDVTELASIADTSFGQGVAIGDVNCDGFDDIYVCNVGVNQLWLNQGDGTFCDGSFLFASEVAHWTVSAAIADLNGDGLAEIYDANYVEGDDVFTRRCFIGGLPRACSPLNFRKASGCLWAVDSQGVFRDVGSRVIDRGVQDGNALGVVVFRLKDHQLPSLFVANDQVANLFLVGTPDANSPLGIRLEDQALLSGLAFDGEGKAQACMGIACADANGDRAMDLLVTNYHDESNSLYLQQDQETFRDATRSSGLVGPSLKMLGFGVQAIDAQLDGNMDLVVLNGHVDDMEHMGINFRMRAQFFTGDGKAQFVEENASQIGEFFESKRVGRALAWLDFDRDGRQDFVATDLEQPASLIHNISYAGNFLALTLVGTQSHRDAIGAEVTAAKDDGIWTQQLTAGNGYMVTNQKSLYFGFPAAGNVDRLEIDWPSGHRQIYLNVPLNTHMLAIENQTQLIAIPREP